MKINYMTRYSIAEILRSSRMSKGKTQKDMVKLLGLSKNTIERWESGYTTPAMDQLFDWFNALELGLYPYICQVAVFPAKTTEEKIAAYIANLPGERQEQLLSYLTKYDLNTMLEICEISERYLKK